MAINFDETSKLKSYLKNKARFGLGIGLLGYYVFNLITTLLAKTHHPRRPETKWF